MSWRTDTRVGRRFSLGLIILAGAGLTIWALEQILVRQPSTLVAASLKTESLQFRVTSPEAARLEIPSGKVLGTNAEACIVGWLVEPAAGAVVTYVRPPGRPLTISVAGKTTRILPDGQREVLPATSWSVDVQAAASGCDPVGYLRLPVQGDRAVFGAHQINLSKAGEIRPALSSGKLQVYGRAQSHFLFFPLSSETTRNALYASGEVNLPGGTVIEDAEADELGPKRISPQWAGHADVDFRDDKEKGIAVEASTNARSVTVYLPAPNQGASMRSSDPETVSLSTMARLVGDPNLQRVYAFFAAVLALLGFISTVRKFLLQKEEP